MAEPERKCATCKFYEPAPIWRKGWCRNPLLYAPQQSHLVAEDDLDCSRGLSDYWEAADGTGPNAGVNIAASGSGRDFFDRGSSTNAPDTGTDSDSPWLLSRNTYDTDADSSYGSAGGSSAGGYTSGYSSVGRTVPPDDDGYAPQESTPSQPASQPRYLGAVGDAEEPDDVRNPWNNSQRGYAAAPTPPPARDRDRDRDAYGGYGAAADTRDGYGATGYDAPATYGQTGAAPADQGYGQSNGYNAAPQGGYGQEATDSGYANGYGGTGGYGQGNEYGAEAGGYGQAGYGQGGYDPNGYGAAPAPPPSVGGTRAPAAGNSTSGRRVTAAPQGRERGLTYYTEERYWTDYAKLAVPVVVVLALLGAIWFIGTGRINGSKGAATGTPGTGTVSAMVGAGTGTPRPGTPGATGSAGTAGAGTPRPANGVTVVPGTGMLPITTVAMTGMTGPVVSNPPASVPTPAMVVTMTKFKIANTGGDGANMRADASTTSAKVTVVPEGTEVQQIGAPQTASDGTWYKVQFGDKQGWIRNDFLAAVTP